MNYSPRNLRPKRVGSGAGAVTGVRCYCKSGSHFSWLSPAGRFTAVTLAGLFRFQPSPPRTVHAVLPHTVHRRHSVRPV
jgi:hypothetical protein